MENPKSFSTFLDGFNLGTFLSLLSLVTLLMKSPTIEGYIFITILIIITGIVVGVVRQYLLIQLTLTKNMKHAFMNSGNNIPTRLLEMRNHKLGDALNLLVGISARLRFNMYLIGALMLLLVLTLLLPTVYSYKIASKILIFSSVWSIIFIINAAKMILEVSHNCHYLQCQIRHLLKLHQFNQTEFGQK
ncbi:hypothetical protein [Turicibacter sp. TJ11]|uniref:hypothetical protein n=1 Tax=Turicibacter sp. TJ11 TaxID=2806443 RepID=UPI001F24D57D|nr:hypothetical protein [Turicibacter sp. TJ11]